MTTTPPRPSISLLDSHVRSLIGHCDSEAAVSTSHVWLDVRQTHVQYMNRFSSDKVLQDDFKVTNETM